MKVLITDKYEQSGVAALEKIGCTVTLGPSLKDDKLIAALGKTACDVLVVRSTRVTADMMSASPNLNLIVRAGSGYDTIDVAAASRHNIRVCNCPGMNAVAVAELVMGLMIALDRRIVDNTIDLRRGLWNKREYAKARGLKGRMLGIIGLGRIGYELAKRAAAFDMDLMYTDVIEHTALENELGIHRVPLKQLLAESDFVTPHVPGGSETKHLIGREELALMKPTAFLLNCSRGGVIDEVALREALESGVIAGAALDVYEVEPGASDTTFADPVVQVSRLYGTHHIGASTEQAQIAVADEVVKIVQAYKDSGKPLHCVNPPEAVAEKAR